MANETNRGIPCLLKTETPALQIENFNNFDLQNQLGMQAYNSGRTDPTALAVTKSDQKLTMSVIDISVLASIGFAGCKLTNTTLYYDQFENYGLRKSGGAITAKAATAFAVPESLSLKPNQMAELGISIYPISADGQAQPITLSKNQTVPPVSTGEKYLYTFAGITINDETIEAKEVSIDFGLQATIDNDGVSKYPTLAFIAARAPKVSVSSPRFDLLDKYGINGTKQAGNIVIKLQKHVSRTAQPLPLTEQKHITITITGGYITCNSANGQSDIEITPVCDSGGAIVSINTSAALKTPPAQG